MKTVLSLAISIMLLKFNAIANNCNVRINVSNNTKVTLYTNAAQPGFEEKSESGLYGYTSDNSNKNCPGGTYTTRNTMWLSGVEGKLVLQCIGGWVHISYSNPAVGASQYFASCGGNLQGYITRIDKSGEPQIVDVVITGGPYVPPPPNIEKIAYNGGDDGYIQGYFTWSFKTGQPQGKFLDAFSFAVYAPHQFTESANGTSVYKNMRGSFENYKKIEPVITVRRVTNCQQEFQHYLGMKHLLHTACDTGFVYAYRIERLPTEYVELRLDIHSNADVSWNIGADNDTKPPAPGCVFLGVLAPEKEYVFKEGTKYFEKINYFCTGAWFDPLSGQAMGDNAQNVNAILNQLKGKKILVFKDPQAIKPEGIQSELKSDMRQNQILEQSRSDMQRVPVRQGPAQLQLRKRSINR